MYLESYYRRSADIVTFRTHIFGKNSGEDQFYFYLGYLHAGKLHIQVDFLSVSVRCE